MAQSGYSINELVQEAQTRWLKPAEVYFILQNYKEEQITYEVPQKPPSGSLFLLNKRVNRFFRKDGHSWRKKKDGRTVGEAHEKLKVGNVEAINCYYAHGDQNPNFQRRSYWILDPAYEHIVLVHYREIREVRLNSASVSRLSTGSPSIVSQTPSSTSVQHPASTAVITEFNDYQSPGSVEVNSDAIISNNGTHHVSANGGKGAISNPSELVVNNVLRRLREKLSFNDNSSDRDSIYNQCSLAELPDDLTDLVLLPEPGGTHDWQTIEPTSTVECNDSLSWEEILDFCENSQAAEWEENNVFTSDGHIMLLPHANGGSIEEQETCQWTNLDAHSHKNNGFVAHGGDLDPQPLPCRDLSTESQFDLPVSLPLPEEEKQENFRFPEYSHGTDPDYFPTVFDHIQFDVPLETDASLTVSQKQKFTIREISPEWGYASDATKVVIVGSFLCPQTDVAWTCMFGDIEVPVQIVQEGILSCQAPPHLPGKVTLCLTSGNRESCSEVREFEYRVCPPSTCASCSIRKETSRSPQELLLLVSFAQMLLSDSLGQKRGIADSEKDLLGRLEIVEDSWDYVIGALQDGSNSLSGTIDWLLEELLKDKLRQWLSCRTGAGFNQQECSLSKKDKGVIHTVAGLGFVWALDPILSSGVGINFRDGNGWTALHWAARFGREKMVAALIASGASAVAVTDPTPQDPIGKTPALIAAANGHKGLAGYLSELSLTSHLKSLTIEESELCKDLAAVEAENAVNIISQSLPRSDDQLSLKDTLDAVRTSTQAASRIQAAFRVYSFKRRQQREAVHAVVNGENEYDVLANDALGLSAVSKLVFRNERDYDKAALSIQKKYKGWKGRKDFLTIRKKVVMIQAHVRGHQVRSQYKVICWAVGILEKAVLRWRRKGVGLRGFQAEMQFVDGNEDEDILKAYRKQRVQKAVQEAVSRVMSMVESPDARQQYRRMLDKFRQAKAKRDIVEGNLRSTSQSGACFMENIY